MSHCRRQASSVTEGTDDRTDEHHGDQGDRVVVLGLPQGIVREAKKDIKEREGSSCWFIFIGESKLNDREWRLMPVRPCMHGA